MREVARDDRALRSVAIRSSHVASPRGRDKPPPQKGAMPSPFIFIATNRLKAGQLERERKRVPGLVEFIEASEPRLIAFNEYVSDAGDEVTVVQIHPDAASMEAHMEIVRERAQQAYAETLDATVRIQVFGQPTDAILEAPPAGGQRRGDQRQRRAPRRLHAIGRPTMKKFRPDATEYLRSKEDSPHCCKMWLTQPGPRRQYARSSARRSRRARCAESRPSTMPTGISRMETPWRVRDIRGSVSG